MDTEKPATVLKDTVAGTSQLDQSGVKITDDIEKKHDKRSDRHPTSRL